MGFDIRYYNNRKVFGFLNINPLVFLIAFGIGMLCVYVMHCEPKVIIKYPTPDNVDSTIYTDDNDNCYKYKAEEVKCPANPNEINHHPLVIS